MKLSILSLAVLATLTSCTERVQPERVNLVTQTNQVIPPQECPDWLGSDNEIPSHNFGCATVTNFGAMVENPRDLITGQHSDYSNGARATAAVSGYETGSTAGSGSSGGSSAASSGGSAQ